MTRANRICTKCGQPYASGAYGDHKSSHARPARLARRLHRGRPAGLVTPHADPILRQVALGVSGADVARQLGISRERVRQIWVKATGTPMPQRPSMQPLDKGSRRIRRLWTKVQVEESGCWLWTGARFPNGYGHMAHPWGYAHRWSYEAFKGPIPDGLVIDHLCRVPSCVNPDHLEAVTNKENIRRGKNVALRHLHALGPVRTTCRLGHPLTVTAGGNRYCKPCSSADNKRRYLRRKAERQAAA